MLHRLAELPILGRGMIVVSPDLSAVATAAAQLAASLQEVAREVRGAPFAERGTGEAARTIEEAPGLPELPAPVPEEEARILVSEPDAFLSDLPGVQERRRDERIAGNETPASVAAGRREIAARIANIGRGGVWLRGALDHLRMGTAVRVALPGAAEAVAARLVRHTEDGAAFAFHQDAATMALVDRALEAIAARRAA
ncbi:PilZ domain-containing protein [Falsiroseomonas sp.]|uniref:PilZ domain-containing protein n=1 Tax=Falsiroseomonas sp. TaxID=2870721 RepID=UPI0035675440